MFSSSIRRAWLCAAMLGALSVPLAAATGTPDAHHVDHPGPHFTLAEALARAQARHPLFASYRAQLQAADGRAVQAGVRPAPALNLTVENAFGTGEISGYSAAETTLGFSQLIERGGLRDRRIETAAAGRQQVATDADIARLDLRAEVARRFVHVLSDQAQLGITREATGLATSTLAEVERRVAAARVPLAERLRAQISLERARLAEEHAEHELLSSRRHLAAATGSMQADFGLAEGDLLRLPPVADFETLLAQVQATPDLLRFASETRLRESELRLAQARRTPGLTLGAGIRRLETSDDVGLIFSASMPLFGAPRERGNILESEARLAQVGPEREQAMLKAQARLYEIWQELNHARVEVEAQRERVVPAVEQALEQTRHAYQRGRYSLLELRDAQAEWASQRRRLIEAASEYHGYLIEIQRLTGAPAPGPAATASSQP
ncbi:TolC family protein [Immundisolibacter sp.]|uniref:TolC family protein n=1 Tax=Immundisolibacter sp. TaxID=1934948 RepID=UPI0035633313